MKFALPEGRPPFNPATQADIEGRLYMEMRRVYLFTEGGHPTLKQKRREELFIQLLESVSPDDAELLIGMKDHELPPALQVITKEIVNLAWPGLVP